VINSSKGLDQNHCPFNTDSTKQEVGVNILSEDTVMMRHFRVYFFNTLTEKRCQYEVLEMMGRGGAGDNKGVEAATKRAEVIDTHKKGVEKKGALGQ
jgi:hypothetical protein